MNEQSEVDKLIKLLSKDNYLIPQKTIFDIVINKIRVARKPWYTKTKPQSIWKRSPLLRLLENSLQLRILLSLLLAYIAILTITFSEKAFKKENICFSLECVPKNLWSVIKVDNIEGFSIAAAATLYLIESRDRKRRGEYDAWQVIDNAQAGSRKKSDARLKALEELNSLRASLRYQHFENIDLQGIDLCKGNLQDADFRNSILKHANFSEALLVNVDFRNADLTVVNFERANLNIAKLENADLSMAKLTKASLRGTDAKGANFRYSKMRKSDLRTANFQGANFSGANLENSILVLADLRNAFILGTKLTNADLSYAKLSGAFYSDKETLPEVFEILEKLNFNYFGLDNHDRYTIFPNGFDPQKAGMLKIELIIDQLVERFGKIS
jgi:BTB/POZ domain-containing protein KCTD9